MTDIVDRLLNRAKFDCANTKWDYKDHICFEAANEIEKLRAEKMALKARITGLETSINRM